MLDHDIAAATDALYRAFPWVQTLDPVRQRVLIDMTFNMGIVKLATFRRMWMALLERQYETAAWAMLDSKWAEQVGHRAITLADMMRLGTVPEGTLVA